MAAAKVSQPVTLEEFIEFALRPENSEREFELIFGEIVEALPTTTYRSQIMHFINIPVQSYCIEHNLPCHISGATRPYDVRGNILLPKFAYKPTVMSSEYPDPVPPLWTANVIAPNDKADHIRAKRDIYMDAGILLWEIYSRLQKIDVYAPGQPLRIVGIDGVLDGGDVLPGFELPIKDLFPET